jgi:hypothetical protein
LVLPLVIIPPKGAPGVFYVPVPGIFESLDLRLALLAADVNSTLWFALS